MDKNLEEALQEEIEEQANVLGQFGGVQSRKKERLINIFILGIAVTVFAVDIIWKLFDPIYAVEFGILLVSIKIIMLIHSLSKMSHFNFWILHSIDLRINEIARKLDQIEKKVEPEGK